MGGYSQSVAAKGELLKQTNDVLIALGQGRSKINPIGLETIAKLWEQVRSEIRVAVSA